MRRQEISLFCLDFDRRGIYPLSVHIGTNDELICFARSKVLDGIRGLGYFTGKLGVLTVFILIHGILCRTLDLVPAESYLSSGGLSLYLDRNGGL